MKPFRQALLISISLAGIIAVGRLWTQIDRPPASSAGDSQEVSLLIRFGLLHPQPRSWDGSLSMEGGRVLSLAGWQFSQGDEILPAHAWKCSTREETYWHSPWERNLQPTKNQQKITAKGLLLRTTSSGQIRLTTSQGEFRFSPAEIAWASSQEFAGGDVVVSRSPAPSRLTEGPAAEDYPAMIESRDGTIWLAYQSYENGGDRLWVRRGLGASAEPLTPAGASLFRPALVEDSAGGVWAVWAEERQGNWDLYARRFEGRRWSSPDRLTTTPGPDIFHALGRDSQGRLYLAWQSFRDGQSDIFLRVHDARGWGPELRVSTDGANDWEPAVAAGPDGRVSIAWDTYRGGNYDVALRHYRNGQLGPVDTVAGGAAFEARPAALYDSSGRLWLAWEEGDADWGKDYALDIADAGMGLLMRRHIRVACYQGGRWRQLPGDLAASLPGEERTVFQKPSLAIDGQGNPWVFFRYRTNTPRATGGEGRFRSVWRLGTASFQSGAWTRLIEFPAGYGRMDAPMAIVTARDGALRVVWNSDSRAFPAARPSDQDLFTATLSPGPRPALPEMAALSAAGEVSANPHPNEAQQLVLLRQYRAAVNGAAYRIVRGDMHRHTDLSWDGNRDGSLFDAYRYALDAAAFEYLGVADHQAGENSYSWWMLQKAVSLFTIPGRFAPLYGYERSLPYPNGHRNAMFDRPAVPVLPIPEGERAGREGAAKLYEYLRLHGGIVMSHTSATGAGTDWRDNDPAIEPLVEIYQGYRRNYEHEGAPRAPAGGGVRPAGYLWKAWEKGLKLGVQSSSDHVSTHTSYAMLYVTGLTRPAVLEAIRARRAYAATDNILVDFRLNGRMMGESFPLAETPRLWARVEGTGPIRKVEVIRNTTYVHLQAGAGASLEMNYVDNQPLQGESYYYIRVEQMDGQLAWASPVWIRRN